MARQTRSAVNGMSTCRTPRGLNASTTAFWIAGVVDADGEPTGAVTAVYPCTNADASARTYTVDSRDLIKAMRDAESRQEELVGVWHSHTHSDAYPSDTDVRQAMEPHWVYVVVSLKHAEPVLRTYRIRDGRVTECEVVVMDS